MVDERSAAHADLGTPRAHLDPERQSGWKPGYTGGKGQDGVWQRIIGQMPPHPVYVEAFAGSAAVFFHKRPAGRSVLIDASAGVVQQLAASAPAHGAVEVIQGDALAILPALDLPAAAVVYCDPPYLLETRRGRRYYGEHELSDDQHRQLLAVLCGLRCRVLLSGYASELYGAALRDWRCLEYRTRTRQRTVSESLWLNFPEPAELHDWRFAGRTFRERLALRRLAARWRARLQAMPARKRGYVLNALAESGVTVPPRQDRREDPQAPTPTRGDRETVLSIFPGADLLGRAFEAEGFCVVRGPDLVWGSDVRDFHPPRGVIGGIIGGSPCQEFSGLNRAAKNPGRRGPTGYGVSMVKEFAQCVTEARPEWFLLENVPAVPAIVVEGYTVQRFNLSAAECGGRQRRNRCFQFGYRDGGPLVLSRSDTRRDVLPAALASEARRIGRRGFADFCELQGLPRSFDLPGLSLAAKYRAVGNGVPICMGRVVAIAVLRRRDTPADVRVCACDCGRPLDTGRQFATAACRKRMQRRRDSAAPPLIRSDTAGVENHGPVTLQTLAN